MNVLASTCAIARHQLEERLSNCQSVFSPRHTGTETRCHKFLGAIEMARLGALANNPAKDTTLRAQIVTRRFGPLTVGLLEHSGGVTINHGNQFQHDHPVIRVAILLKGAVTAHFGDHMFADSPGCGVLVPGDVPFTYIANEPVALAFVDIAIDDPQFAPCAGLLGHWKADSLDLVALGDYVRRIVHGGNTRPDHREIQAIRRSLAALTQATLSTAPPIDEDGVDKCLPARALATLNQNHRDPNFNVAKIATAIGISERSLHLMFEHHGHIGQRLRIRRTETALELLANPTAKTVRLNEIAHRSGFGSTDALTEAVRTATGQTPGRWRAIQGSA